MGNLASPAKKVDTHCVPKTVRKISQREISILFMLLNTLVWGAALPISKPALSTISPFEFLFLRFLFATVFSAPVLLFYLNKVRHKRKKIPSIFLLEILGTAVALGLLYSGLQLTSAIEASLITTTTPIFIIIGGYLFLKEKVETHEFLGLMLAFFGTIILAAQPLLTFNTVEFSGSLLGNFLILGQNIAIASYYLIAKRHYHQTPKLFISSVSFYVGMIAFFFISFFQFQTEQFQPSVYEYFSHLLTDLSTPAVFTAVIYMALFGSIIGLTAYIKGQDGIEASEAAVFTYLQPLVFIPLAVLWLGEKITVPTMIAMGFIAVGVVVAEWKRRGRIKKA